MFCIKNWKNRIDFPLLAIVLVAALLRLAFLNVIPNGFQQDEAAAGYDAYSILKTLHTQYDQFLPLFSKTYEGTVTDYDESNYRFLLIPFISIFGLNEFTTRLPAALIGIFNVLTLYYFAREFFNRRIALVSAFFMAISPWHIQISRIAFRTVLFPCIFCLALFLFFKSLRDRKYLPFSGLCFGICLYTYTSARVFVPLFLLGLLYIYREELWRNKLQTFLAALGFLAIFFWLFSDWISPELMERANASICWHCLINDPFLYFLYYISYFYPGFLFLGDPSVRTTAVHTSFLLFTDLITIGISLVYIFKKKDKKYSLLWIWLLLYPIPAALTAGAYDLRAAIGIPLFCLLSAYGFVIMLDSFRTDSLKKVNARKYFQWLAICSLIASFLFFFDTYFIGYYVDPPKSFQYGLREAIAFAEKSSYNCVVMSDRFHRLNTMIAFYTQYPPDRYKASPIQPYTLTDYTVGKYHVISIAKAQVFNDQCLYVIEPKEAHEIADQGYQLHRIHVVKNVRKQQAIIELVKIS